MAHPPLPWKLEIADVAIAVVRFIDIAEAREAAPPGFDVVAVLPGKTIGGLFYARYGPGSDLEYNELGIFGGFVKFAGKRGLLVTNMYVDNEDSVLVGREQMHLPKEIAEFDIQQGDRTMVTVRRNDKLICTISYGRQFYAWRQRIRGGAFGVLGPEVMRFGGEFNLRYGITSGMIGSPPESPVATLDLNGPRLVFCAKDGHATLGTDLESVG